MKRENKITLRYTTFLFTSIILLGLSYIFDYNWLKNISHFVGYLSILLAIPICTFGVWASLKFKSVSKHSTFSYIIGLCYTIPVFASAYVFKYVGWDFLGLLVFITALLQLFINHCMRK